MGISSFRDKIDTIDKKILQLLGERSGLALKIAQEKVKSKLSHVSHERESRIIKTMIALNKSHLDDEDIISIYSSIIDACRNVQDSKVYQHNEK